MFICGDCHKEHPVPTREEDREGQPCVQALSRERDALKLQNRESGNMISVLIQYIHDLKRHQASIQFCKEEPCQATLEFMGRAENRKSGPECTCSIDGTPFCKAKGTGYCQAENELGITK
jgi:hypothetical protein